MTGVRFSCLFHTHRRKKRNVPSSMHTTPAMTKGNCTKTTSFHSGDAIGKKSRPTRIVPTRSSLRPRRGLSGRFSANHPRAFRRPFRNSMKKCSKMTRPVQSSQGTVYIVTVQQPILVPGYTALPHAAQKCAPAAETAPQWEQNRPELTGTPGMATYLSGERAQMSATIQPTTVQPNSRFTKKIPMTSALFRPRIVGMKYSRPKRIKNRIFAPPQPPLGLRHHTTPHLLNDTRWNLRLFHT